MTAKKDSSAKPAKKVTTKTQAKKTGATKKCATKKSVATKKTETKKITTKKCGAKKPTKKEMFTKDTTLGEVILKKPESEAILLGFGMHCFGCFVSQMETLEEAAEVHGIELDYLLKKLNEL